MSIREFSKNFPCYVKPYNQLRRRTLSALDIHQMMFHMKRLQQEFKWCKYILLSYHLPIELFFHIKPFLFTPSKPYYSLYFPIRRPYLKLSCVLYNLGCVHQQYMRYILFIAESYDRLGLSQEHTVSFFSGIEYYLCSTENALNIVNNWN
jgi:hypothetical protein